MGEPILARPVGRIARGWRGAGEPERCGPARDAELAIVAGFAGVSTQWLRAERQAEWSRRENAVTNVKLALHEYEEANIAMADQYLEACPPDRRFLEWHLVRRLCHRERQTFAGHDWYIWDIDYSPSGDRIASVAGGFYYSIEPGQGELLVREAAYGQGRLRKS